MMCGRWRLSGGSYASSRRALVGDAGFPLALGAYLDYAAINGAGYAEIPCDELALDVGSLPLKFACKLMIDERDVLRDAFNLISGNPCTALVALDTVAATLAALASAAALSLLWQQNTL